MKKTSASPRFASAYWVTQIRCTYFQTSCEPGSEPWQGPNPRLAPTLTSHESHDNCYYTPGDDEALKLSDPRVRSRVLLVRDSSMREIFFSGHGVNPGIASGPHADALLGALNQIRSSPPPGQVPFCTLRSPFRRVVLAHGIIPRPPPSFNV